MKTLAIIGLVLSGISWICMVGFNNPYSYESAIGWGVIAMFYLIAISIVVLVKMGRK